MTLLVGIPVVLPPRRAVVESWNHTDHFLIINGAKEEWRKVHVPTRARGHVVSVGYGRNIGVAAAWNHIFHEAQVRDLSHVALMSQGTVLNGGTARLAELVDEYADWRGLLTDFAFHCCVFSVKLWEKVGPFDERFFAYSEDCDYVRRLFCAGFHSPGNPMPKVGRDLLDGTESFAASLRSGVLPNNVYGESWEKFKAKWGGEPFHETFDRPDDPTSFNPTNNWSHADAASEAP